MSVQHPIVPAANAIVKGTGGKMPPTQAERTMKEYIKRNGTKNGPPSEFGFGVRRIANFFGLYGD